MGLCGSTDNRTQERYRVATRGKMEKFLQKLDISQGQVEKAFAEFEKVDKDKSGEINVDEFFDLFHLDWSEFGMEAFCAMDVSGDHRITFVEFFVGLYNYCTMDKKTLVKFSFDLYDVDGSGEMDSAELRKLILLVHGKKSLDEKACSDLHLHRLSLLSRPLTHSLAP